MKIKVWFSVLLVLLMIFVLYGSAWARGGSPEPGPCEEPPEVITGPFIWGTFTVARDKKTLSSEANAHYNVQIRLRRLCQEHLFSFFSELLIGDSTFYIDDCYETNLCDVLEAELLDWYTGFGAQPCLMGVGEAFGLSGTPVIQRIIITNRDFCGCEDAMIAGRVVIRVVPTE